MVDVPYISSDVFSAALDSLGLVAGSVSLSQERQIDSFGLAAAQSLNGVLGNPATHRRPGGSREDLGRTPSQGPPLALPGFQLAQMALLMPKDPTLLISLLPGPHVCFRCAFVAT